MGFRTLAIEKRSSEVWRLLAAVKTEFLRFGGVLESARKKLDAAGDDLEKLVGARSRKILKHLGQVDRMKPEEAEATLQLDPGGDAEESGEGTAEREW